MKLEQPEIAGYIQNVILKWMPLLFVDGHVARYHLLASHQGRDQDWSFYLDR